MFIKVHKAKRKYEQGTGWFIDTENAKEAYVNTDNIHSICKEDGYTGICFVDGTILVTESADEIMKIITYFKVANDK